MLTPSDFLGLIGVEDPQISPDGRTIVYVRAQHNLDENRTERSLWRIRKTAAEPFTQGIADRAPRWSTDGTKIAFLRTNEEKETHLFVMPADGGEPRAIAGPFKRIGGAAWSPDSLRLAFAAAVDVDGDKTTVAFDEKSGARHIVALPYKHDSIGLFDGKRMQIHVATLDGDVKVVAQGSFDAGMPAWAPDGMRIAFVANPGVGERLYANDLYDVAPDGGDLRRLTSMDGIFDGPAYSRDGRELAFVGYEDDKIISGARNRQLWCVAAEGGKPRSLTPDRKEHLGDAIISDMRAHENAVPFWSPDDQAIVIQRSLEGCCELVAYKRDGTASQLLVGGEMEIYAFSGARTGAIAFASSDLRDPGSIAHLRSDGTFTRYDNENAAWLKAHPPLVPERMRPKADDGTELDAWLIRAAEENGTPPLVHAVHGGPHAAYGFTYFFEFQLLAQLGMHVVFGNPRGSQSYGETYADAITGKWGDLDAADVLAILRAAKERLPIDAERIGLQGGSYGGFMTTWLLGHCKEYACGVSMRAVNEYLTEGSVNDIPGFLEYELKVDWSDGGRKLFEASPMRAVENIDAPLLIMHSERDFRCPIDQGEQLFGRLRALGKTAEFVRFANDGHDLSRNGTPRNKLLRYRALSHWLRRYLGVERSEGGAGWLFSPIGDESENVGAGAP
ncbi:MAG TPA: S9 family peptidase [Candidatus Acidoferrales bacterium]|nr:S9 family peptidase [Candidatus Acidoferrales bacterium]